MFDTNVISLHYVEYDSDTTLYNTDFPGITNTTAPFKQIFNSEMYPGTLGDFKHRPDVAITNKYRNIPGNIILDELTKKRTQNTAYETAKTTYETDKTTYNTKLNALLGREFDLWFYLFPTLRPAEGTDNVQAAIVVPNMPNRPAIPSLYSWNYWPTTIATSPYVVTESFPSDNMGGFGWLTSGIMGGDAAGKSFGLLGPSAATTTLSAAEQGISSTRAKMTTPCTAHYLAVTVMPRSTTTFTQSTADKLELEIGAYAWGTYDWSIPAQPSLAGTIDLGATYLNLSVLSIILASV